MRRPNWIAVVVLLQLVIVAGQWLGSPRTLSVAEAQITDPGRDRMQMLDVLRGIDAKLEKMNDLLASGKLQVRTTAADEGKGAGGR